MIPVTVMQNAQNVDFHTKVLILMDLCGSVVIFVTPGIICHVQMCVVLTFQQSLHALTANRKLFCMASVFLYIICIYNCL